MRGLRVGRGLMAAAIAAGLGLLGAGCGFAKWGDPSTETGSSATGMQGKNGNGNGVEPIPVRVWVVKKSPVLDVMALPCGAEAYDVVDVSAEIGGRVTSITHDEGERVKKGEVLVQLNVDTLKAELDRAQATCELADATYARYKNLFDSKQIAENQMDKARADRDIARSEVEMAKVRLAKATILCPLDGSLEKRYVDVGEYVMTGNRLVEVVRVDMLKVYVEVPEKDVTHLAPGMQVGLHFGFNGEGEFPGVIENIDRVADPVTHTFRTKVVVENKELLIRPGMIGRMVLMRGKPVEGIAVPLNVVIALKGRRYVVVVEEGKAVERDVKLGKFDGQRIQVASGLKEGETLIVEGQREINDGDPVKIIPDEGEPTGSGTETGAPAIAPGTAASAESGDENK